MRRLCGIAALAAGMTLAICAPVRGDEGAQRPFTVTDAIELTSVLRFAGAGESGIVHPSPDGTHLLMHLRRGDVKLNLVIETLVLYDRDRIAAYLEGREALAPRARVLVTQAGNDPRDDDSGQITRIRWADASTIVFLARATNGYKQVTSVDIRSGRKRELTRQPADVRQFDWARGHLLFYATSPSAQYPMVRDLDSGVLPQLPATLLTSPPSGYYVSSNQLMLPVALYRSRGVDREPLRINVPETLMQGSDTRIWQSPTGRHAIVLDRRVDAPTSWSDYAIKRDDLHWPWPADSFSYYQLIDLERNSARPLLNAPSGQDTFNGIELDVSWSSDGRTVVVTNTFVPHSTDKPVTAKVDLISGRYEIVTSAPDSAVAASKPLFELSLEQGLNARPKIFARGQNGVRKLLFDPNPQMERLQLGPVEIVKWTDDEGRQWKAGLLLPIDKDAGPPYPLVVQTHGFDDNAYLIDGPFGYTSGYAARALAAAGMAVLQVQEPQPVDSVPIARSTADGYAQGIRKLIAEGIANEDAVGFAGFSYTGIAGVFLLTEHSELIRAATFSDALGGGYVDIIAAPDAQWRTQPEFASPDFTRIGAYFARNPLYSLARSRAATRLEAIGLASVQSNWEAYSVLRQRGCPVDLVWFPSGTHVLAKPAELLASQGGTVDWFRFWLRGDEDAEGSKQPRFERWRQMKACRSPAAHPR
jgi:dipeptidyl aminopeptidase/acylaminoacyl peptidase